MRWFRWMAVTLVLGSMVLGLALWSCAPAQQQATPGAMTPEQKVSRGEYLVAVGSCNDCHSPGGLYGGVDSTRRLAGSEIGWVGPWGVTFARNLTPDVETGIGAWTEDQIARAIRTGQRPDGSTILPPMPWPSFAKLTDEDALAIAAYLRSITPVRHVVPAVVKDAKTYKGAALVFPPPPAWDAPATPPDTSATDTSAASHGGHP